MTQIHQARTTPHRPSGNGQVERFNRTLMDAVRCFVQNSPGIWDLYLAQIAGALRSCVNRDTDYTPNKLMLGREVCQPADLLYPLKQEDLGNGKTQDQYLAELEIARDKLKGALKRMSRGYDLRTLEK